MTSDPRPLLISSELLESLVDDGDCWFDHHGGCQEHGYLSLEPGEVCPQQQIKDMLSGVSVTEPDPELRPNRDSPRWCETCQAYGDHHTDRHPAVVVPGEPTSINEMTKLWQLAEAEAVRQRLAADRATELLGVTQAHWEQSIASYEATIRVLRQEIEELRVPGEPTASVNAAKTDLIHELHTAIYGSSWARPQSPKEVWEMLLDRVRDLAQAVPGEPTEPSQAEIDAAADVYEDHYGATCGKVWKDQDEYYHCGHSYDEVATAVLVAARNAHNGKDDNE